MNEQIAFKLWVIKFCIKVIYPKYNFYAFIIYLSIQYRLRCIKKARTSKVMDAYNVKTIPPHIASFLAKNTLDYNLPIVLSKCIIISREQYIQLASENLFCIDNGVLWLAMKLSPDAKRKFKEKQSIRNKHNIYKFMSSEIQKKLWKDSKKKCVDNIRITPVVGCKMVMDNLAYTTDEEFHNITACLGMHGYDNIEVTFHPLPSLECTPKVAEMAEVGLIVNQFDLANDFTKQVLANHFEVPKLMSLNDMFYVELKPTITGKYHYKYIDFVETLGKLCFKCTKLGDEKGKEPSKNNDKVIRPFFIVRRITKLSLDENLNARKPKEQYFKYQDCEINMNPMPLCPTGLRHKFEQLQDAITPFVTGEINELSTSMTNPIIPLLLLTGSIGSGRNLLVRLLAKRNGMNLLPISCNILHSSIGKQTERKLTSTIQRAKESAPVIVLLENFEIFALDSEFNEDCRVMEHFMQSLTDLYQNYTKHPIIFIAVTERRDLKPNIQRIFIDKIHFPRLNVQARYEILEWFATVMQLNIDGEEDVKSNTISDPSTVLSKASKEVLLRVAAKTETFLHGDLDTLMHFTIRESYMKQYNSNNQLPPETKMQLVKEEDFNSALESIRSLHSQHLDAPKIPKVYWEDIGGLEELKRELLKTIEFPIKYPHLFKNANIKRSGLLLYGPPGCGKTLVAKAVSTEMNVSFLSVKGPELLNMYIGQSEENVRKVFQSARASSPCIVFLDELDALAPRRGAAGDSGGASDRVVSQLLAEVDGVTGAHDVDSSSFVFIMGATNRPDLLDQSLLRPGRLDKLIYVGPYCGLQQKTSVLKALCRNHILQEDVDLGAVAAALPERCTGADLLQVVDTARSATVRGLISKLRAGYIKESELTPDSINIGVKELWQAVKGYRPSVTEDDLAYYESLKSQM